MIKLLRSYLARKDGAVSVDWVVLTGAVTLVAAGAVAYVTNSGLDPLVGNVASNMVAVGGGATGIRSPIRPLTATKST